MQQGGSNARTALGMQRTLRFSCHSQGCGVFAPACWHGLCAGQSKCWLGGLLSRTRGLLSAARSATSVPLASSCWCVLQRHCRHCLRCCCSASPPRRWRALRLLQTAQAAMQPFVPVLLWCTWAQSQLALGSSLNQQRRRGKACGASAVLASLLAPAGTHVANSSTACWKVSLSQMPDPWGSSCWVAGICP